MSVPQRLAPDGAQQVSHFRTLLARELGLAFDDRQLGTLARVLDLVSAGQRQAYLAALEAAPSPQALGRLAAELTVTETYFYRHGDQLRAFTELVLPACLAEGGTVEVLSAGCASGEEPYTLAMLAREAGVAGVAIHACDINPAMLARATAARYSNWALRELPAPQRARWFVQEGDLNVLDKRIVQSVAFEARNLALDDPAFWRPGRFHVIFCRNVLMYFSPSQAQAAVARMAAALRPGGYLFLGHAETLRGLSNDFELCHSHGSFYYQRKGGALTAPPVAPPPFSLRLPDPALDWADAIGRAARRIDALAADSAGCQSGAPAAAAPGTPDLQPALASLRAEQFDAVLGQLANLPARDAHDPDVLLLKAVTLAQSGRRGDAEQCCARLLAGDTLHAGAHYVLGLCREAAGDAGAALEHYQSAAYLDPLFAMAHLHAGLLLRRQGERDTAQRELQQAAALLVTEDPSRLLLFGSGFPREALLGLCRAELAALERGT
jgi:chemotaxis protein methyltransferase CheR